MFKTGNEMVFRIKDLQQMQNNTGTRLDSLIKSDILKRLNVIMDEDVKYSDAELKAITQLGFCVIVEILMRQYNNDKKDGKVWYLDPETAMYSEITKYQKPK
jgi:hypothetical protein